MVDEKLLEKVDLCTSCGRFDKPDRMKKVAEVIFKKIQENPINEVVALKGNCAVDSCIGYLNGLLRKQGYNNKVKPANNGESNKRVYDVVEICLQLRDY